jgi:anti-sigma factor RsiW
VQKEDGHLSDQELLLAADGELRTRRGAYDCAHLARCEVCRSRMAEIEGVIADCARIYAGTFDPKLSSVDGPRALLRAQLAELGAKSEAGSWRRFFQFSAATRAAAFVCVALCLAAIVGRIVAQHSALRAENAAVIAIEPWAVPDRGLTPGATREVTRNEVCAMAHEEVVREVPVVLRQQVFQEYGIVNARAEDYEIDYLITPGLGGADDIRNLWPEPYTSTAWNARVKDALEERLHEMVCAGQLDLSTAQRDIASDWIAAYKKYFHTDRPLADRSDVAILVDKSYVMLERVVVIPIRNRCGRRCSS